MLQREGVIDVNPWAFIGGVFALKASSELKPGEYSFQKKASLRDVIGTIVEGKVVQHSVTIAEGLTSDRFSPACPTAISFPAASVKYRAKAPCCPRPINFRAALRATR